MSKKEYYFRKGRIKKWLGEANITELLRELIRKLTKGKL